MSPRSPFSALRWLIALLVLGGMLFLLVERAPEQSIPEPVEVPTEALVVTDTASEVFGEPLPALQSLEELDLATPPARRGLDLQHWQTSQGTPVYYMHADELPMLDVQILFAAGASRDGELPGLAGFTNAMLNEGTGNLDAGDIAAGFERLGAQFSNSAHRDMGLLGLRTLTASDKLEPALSLFAQILAKPSFPEASLQRIREQMLAGLRYARQRPDSQASEALWSTLYPGHPYGIPPDGTQESINAITREDLQRFQQTYYNASNAVIALVGAVDRQRAEQLAQHLADAMPQGDAAPRTPAPEPVSASTQHIDFASNQTHLLIAQQGISRDDPDYAALYLGNQILGGGGFGSRLVHEIREQRGLAYSPRSTFSAMQAPGPFYISIQTRADQAEQALDVANQVLDEFIRSGPTDTELSRAKQQMLGEFPLSTASNGAIVSQLGAIGFYDLPLNYMQLFLDRVQALTSEDIRDAFARQLPADRRVIITVGPPQPEPEQDSSDTESDSAAQTTESEDA
ncbi:MAG: peptidase M16 [Pseudomonadales bacterium]|nr:peptidase M16 [Pseudomonadales bacterium]